MGFARVLCADLLPCCENTMQDVSTTAEGSILSPLPRLIVCLKTVDLIPVPDYDKNSCVATVLHFVFLYQDVSV